MTQHTHRTFVDGCYRCDLSRDEAIAACLDTAAKLREHITEEQARHPEHTDGYHASAKHCTDCDLIDTLIDAAHDIEQLVAWLR